jgi:phage major head subunit gpT-like protein
MPINTSAIASELRPGLAACFGNYDLYPSQWSEIFDTYESDKADEIETEMRFLGVAQFRDEGAPTAVDTMAERYRTVYHHRYLALSFIITRQAIMDNLYKTQFPQTAKALKRSMSIAKEILGAAVLNNGFTTSIGGDGQPLYSLTHPIDTGIVPNTLPGLVDLTEAGIEQAITQIRVFKDIAGLTIAVKPLKLIVSPKNEWQATRILGSAFRTQTANNDINAIYNNSAIPEGARVNVYLNNNGNWFLTTDAPDGFKHYIREALETDVYTDFSTDNLMAKAVERYSFGFSNFRCSFGVQAA